MMCRRERERESRKEQQVTIVEMAKSCWKSKTWNRKTVQRWWEGSRFLLHSRFEARNKMNQVSSSFLIPLFLSITGPRSVTVFLIQVLLLLTNLERILLGRIIRNLSFQLSILSLLTPFVPPIIKTGDTISPLQVRNESSLFYLDLSSFFSFPLTTKMEPHSFGKGGEKWS